VSKSDEGKTEKVWQQVENVDFKFLTCDTHRRFGNIILKAFFIFTSQSTIFRRSSHSTKEKEENPLRLINKFTLDGIFKRVRKNQDEERAAGLKTLLNLVRKKLDSRECEKMPKSDAWMPERMIKYSG
jgi:hypothetical protein